MPADAVWPRLMTAPHPDAVGSLGVEFEWWCRTYRGVDAALVAAARRRAGCSRSTRDGRLVWRVLILTLARQLGKSWLLWLILSWRLHQGDRFGEPQRLLHMSIQMSQVRDVMEPRDRTSPSSTRSCTRRWTTTTTRSIEWLADGSKWVRVVRGTGRAGGAYGQSAVAVGCGRRGVVDPGDGVDDGLEPTLVEGEQSWLLLVSTAHRLATALMIDRRLAALDDLATVGDPVLLVEWSTPRHFALDDVEGWRMASPWWSPRARPADPDAGRSARCPGSRRRTTTNRIRSSRCVPSG